MLFGAADIVLQAHTSPTTRGAPSGGVRPDDVVITDHHAGDRHPGARGTKG